MTTKSFLGFKYHSHDWSEWEDYRQFLSEREGAIILIQRRICKSCKKVELIREKSI